jgi:hypothetical protein
MIRTTLAVAIVAATAITMSPASATPQKKRPAKAAAAVAAAHPRQENQFVTVDEFVKGRRAPKTAVSVEGYAVSAYKAADGSLRLTLVDSIDHVLSATDADNFGKGGASATIPAPALAKNPRLAWTAKGMQRFGMYAANVSGRAQKQLHDIVAKIRVTGYATGRVITPVTNVEYQDDNGDWKAL